jgi:multidrug efflux pump subunit AcrA (membrane-fusion protein)
MKIKKRYIIIVVIIVIIGAVLYGIFGRKKEIQYTTAKVEKGDIVQTVSETGTVKSASQLDLNFSSTGRLNKKMIKTGDKVKAGQLLAELDYLDLTLKINSARANVTSAQANLNKVLNGASKTQIAVSESAVDQAKTNLKAAENDLAKLKKSVSESIKQAEKNVNDLNSDKPGDLTTYEQGVRIAETNFNNTKSQYQRLIDNSLTNGLSAIDSKLDVDNYALDNIDRILNDTDAKNLLSVKDITFLNLTKSNYDQAKDLRKIALDSLVLAQNNKSAINIAFDDTSAALKKTQNALNYCFKTLENSITSDLFSQTDLDGFKSTVSAQLTAVNAAITAIESSSQVYSDAQLSYNNNINAAEKNLLQAQAALDNARLVAGNTLSSARISGDQQITSGESRVESARRALSLAIAQLDQVKSPARYEDVASARALVDQANSTVSEINKQIDNFKIKAPIDGVITKINYEIGEQTSPTKAVVTMIGQNMFEIDVDISESDIAKIKLADKSEITLDAYGEDVKFSGAVFFIEPAETIIQDVIYYKVKIVFNPGKYEIRSGMTANISITTNSKNGVLRIPSRAIIEKNNEKIVKVLKNNQPNDVAIKIGLRGDEGLVEVLTGLKEGDELVLSTPTK